MPNLSSHPPTQIRWLVFALACGTSFLLYLHRYCWGVVKGSVKGELGLSDLQLGWLDSAFAVTYAVGQIPGGAAGDLFGPRRMLSLMILLWSGALAWIGLGQGMLGLAASRAAFGAAQAGVFANLAKVTKSWFPLSVRTSVQGAISTFSGRLGGACSSLVVSTMLMGLLGFDWRTALYVVAALGAVLAIAFWLLFRNSPAEHPWCNEEEVRVVSEGSAPDAAAASSPGGLVRSSGSVTLAVLLLHSFTSTLPDMLYLNWIPIFLEEAKGFGKVEMGIYAMFPLIGGALGGLFGGTLNDVLIRVTGNRRLSRSAVGLTGKVVSGGLMAWAITLEDGRAVMCVLAASKFFTDWSLPTQWATVTDIAGRAAGTVFGVVNTVGSIAGIVAGPLIGFLKQGYGWETLFYLMSAVYVVSGLCWIGIDCTKTLGRGQ
jgi:ACS family glucarate transporter-like MFS transporter